MLQVRLARQARLARGAEDLLEMAMLAMVDHIQDQVGILLAHPFDDGGQVGGAVQNAAFGLDQDQRRQRLLVVGLSNIDHQRAFAQLRQAARLKVGDHGRDQRIDAGLAVPQIEADAQGAELALQTLFGHRNEMAPQRAIARPPGLQIDRGTARRFQPLRIGLAGG